MSVEKIENRDVCAKCGGRCCKNTPCGYLPLDFIGLDPGDKYQKQAGVFKRKIDVGEAGVKVLFEHSPIGSEFPDGIIPFFAMGAVGESGRLVDFYGADDRCRLLGESGCRLALDERPSMGAAIIPNERSIDDAREGCGGGIEREDFIKQWLPYQLAMRALVRKITGKKIEDVVLGRIAEYDKDMRKRISTGAKATGYDMDFAVQVDIAEALGWDFSEKSIS